MKHTLLLFFSFIIVCNYAYSQTDTNNIARNLVFLEAGGAGGYGSINYERKIYSIKKITLALRAGLSTFSVIDFTQKFNPDIIVPIALNGVYGQKHGIQMGVGITYSNVVQANFGDVKTKRISNASTFFTIGYRYHNYKNGLVFAASYTPIIEFNKSIRHWAAISLGYSF